jgi:hypothetical protein
LKKEVESGKDEEEEENGTWKCREGKEEMGE